jgi:hypothetical protein
MIGNSDLLHFENLLSKLSWLSDFRFKLLLESFVDWNMDKEGNKSEINFAELQRRFLEDSLGESDAKIDSKFSSILHPSNLYSFKLD